MGSLHFCQVQAEIVSSPGNSANGPVIDKHPVVLTITGGLHEHKLS